MRQAQDFVVYPFRLGQTSITIQSERCIASFEPETGKGLINWRGSNSKNFAHLTPMLGAELYQFDADFVLECQAAQPGSGDYMGGGCVTIA